MCIKQNEDVVNKKIKSCIKSVKILDNGTDLIYEEDALAKTTQHTRATLAAIGNYYAKFQESNYYKILFGTTQPAHFVMAISVACITYFLLQDTNDTTIYGTSPLWMLLYLGTFSMHFGAQIWMTFISGLALYFTQPRHTFGNVQKVLFPMYFLFNAGLSFITLVLFITVKNGNPTSIEIFQVITLTLCFMIELGIRLYLAPPLLRLIEVKNQLEAQAGIGMEIGRLNIGKLADCPYYLKIHRTFRKIHLTISFGNCITLCCTIFHLYYLSHKMCNFL